jgi:hypothetical protein
MKLKTKKTNKFRTNILASAISICLPCSLQAANFNVTAANDDGTGSVANTLSWAIIGANSDPGDDTITLVNDITITGVMKRLVNSNVVIQSADAINRKTISGGDLYRPLFIKSGTVTIQNLNISNGLAKGGDSDDGAPGAGMGGSIFIYDGNVNLKNISITNSTAVGGDNLANNSGIYGGGGMFGNAGSYGGGGLFGSANGTNGGYGGVNNYNQSDPKFGLGGSLNGASSSITNGGFGGGGGVISGNGGFGGGGAQGSGYINAGNGGFGAGAPYFVHGDGSSGYGGSLNASAGMGGAVFVRTGTIEMTNVAFNNNTATASGGAKGLGGGLFILHSLTNSNNNNQGMPSALATVSGCGVTFTNNTATGDTAAGNNNDNIFDLGNLSEDLTQICPVSQNLIVTVANDDGLGMTDNTLSWAIKESNSIFGDDTITLATDVIFTDVMKRLINSNMMIQSDGTRRTISGNSLFRPLFIKSGQVTLRNFDMENGMALGGDGFAGGAGMGGSVFIYDGTVIIDDITVNNSMAIGGISNSSGGGGGMLGDGDIGGGGLFESASGINGGAGGFYGVFGQGGSHTGLNGNFGGGGVSNSFFAGGSGGFGGGGGRGGVIVGTPVHGSGGFGGGGFAISGYAASTNGAGMGGAVFIRGGLVDISNSSFTNGLASASSGSKGLGGGVFILHSTTNSGGSQQGMPSTLATVTTCNLTFDNNTATSNDSGGNSTDNIFDLGGRINDCIFFSDGFED